MFDWVKADLIRVKLLPTATIPDRIQRITRCQFT